jgi:pimeloyl-ACP methyl ester carboxylesterase
VQKAKRLGGRGYTVSIALLLCVPAWHWSLSWYQARLYPPRGETFAGLHIYCQGAGEPTVLFETGVGGTYLDFIPIQKEVARFTRACTYDRAGLGWSPSSPRPRTAQNAAAELLEALGKAGMDNAVVMVAHSYGALVAQSVAVQAPERLAALILLDPSYPAELRVEGAPSAALAPLLPVLAMLGVWRFRELFDAADPRVSPETSREMAALTNRTGHVRTFFKEIQALPESSQFLELHPASARLEDPLVIVLGRGLADGSPDLAARHAQQRNLALAFPLGSFEVLDGTGHFLYLDASEKIVATVRETVESARHATNATF